MIGEPLRLAARRRHDVHVGVAGDVRREGDSEPSGEKCGSVSTAGVDVSRRAVPPARVDPEVAAVLEGDRVAADRWVAQETGALRIRARYSRS